MKMWKTIKERVEWDDEEKENSTKKSQTNFNEDEVTQLIYIIFWMLDSRVDGKQWFF